jgi:pyruvate/2-oxoglutarate dehydrogenase complex dihydrolipoamide acyltransferase (E2) component
VSNVAQLFLPDDAWAEEEEGVLSNWFYRDGAEVREGSPVAEVMVAKVEFEIVAPISGTLKIDIPQEGTIRKGAPLGSISTSSP